MKPYTTSGTCEKCQAHANRRYETALGMWCHGCYRQARHAAILTGAPDPTYAPRPRSKTKNKWKPLRGTY